MNTCLSFTYRLVTFFKNNNRYSHERKFLHNMQLRTLVRNMRNLFTNGKPKSSLLRNSIQRFPCVPAQIGIWKRWFKGERKTGKPRKKKKKHRRRDENQKQTQHMGHTGGRQKLSPLRHPCSPFFFFRQFVKTLFKENMLLYNQP